MIINPTSRNHKGHRGARTVYPADVAHTPPCSPRIAALAILPLPTRLLSTYAVSARTRCRRHAQSDSNSGGRQERRATLPRHRQRENREMKRYVRCGREWTMETGEAQMMEKRRAALASEIAIRYSNRLPVCDFAAYCSKIPHKWH